MQIKGVVLVPRVNINISDEMKDYFEKKSKETGVPQSALMVMAISEYLDQKKMINSIEPMLRQMELLQNIKDLNKTE